MLSRQPFARTIAARSAAVGVQLVMKPLKGSAVDEHTARKPGGGAGFGAQATSAGWTCPQADTIRISEIARTALQQHIVGSVGKTVATLP